MKQIFVNFSEILRWHNFPFDPTLLGRCHAPVFFMVLTRLGPLFIYKRILFFAETFAVSLTPPEPRSPRPDSSESQNLSSIFFIYQVNPKKSKVSCFTPWYNFLFENLTSFLHSSPLLAHLLLLNLPLLIWTGGFSGKNIFM